MNKKDLIKGISNRTGFTIRITKTIVNCLVNILNTALKQDKRIVLKDFGAFYNIQKPSKRYFDVRTGKIRTSHSKKVVKFIPYKRFKKLLTQSKIINIREENDGSTGDIIAIDRYLYSTKQYPHETSIKVNDKTVQKPKDPEKNTVQRIARKPTQEIINLTFDGLFIFDHFLGEKEHKVFPSLKVPQKGTPILMPQVDKIGTTTGVMEPILMGRLISMCEEIRGIKVLKNIKLPIFNRNYSYRPDFCLYWEKINLYIDIEIDEPYDIVSRKPIHYQGNGDNLRDRYFIRNGWCVLRFTEQQVQESIESVINYVKRTLRWLTNDNHIKIRKNSLNSIDRWTFEEASDMSLNNLREHYLNLPNWEPSGSIIDTESTEDATHFVFIKPDEDILPDTVTDENESKYRSIINDFKQSKREHCLVTRTNGYQWIYLCNSLDIQSINGVYQITGESPLGIDYHFPIDEIATLSPIDKLFSDIHWESDCCMSSEDFDNLRKLLFDAIVYGKPIWITYNSNNTGYSRRFLSNITYAWDTSSIWAPHIGLGHCKKYGLNGLSHFYAYCSYRKEFRCFAADGRIRELKVLNGKYVYTSNQKYANSFAHLVMSPYESHNGNAFFENADEILRIMPRNEFESIFVQGNLANLLVMKGEIDQALMIYQKFPFDYFVSPSLTWGEICISDIQFFINLCKEHLTDSHYYEGLEARILLHNFNKVLKLLKQSSWMHF